MANKKLKLLYLARYLQEQTDEQHPKTMQDMIAYLAGCGISAERKSLYDDLELLRVYGMDVQSVKGKSFGYFLGERDFQLPELKLLIDVVQASPFLTQSKSMALIGKLERLTSRPNARQLRRQVYVMDRVKTHNERLYYAIDGLNTAINDGKKVTFRYFDWTAAGGKAYRRDGALYETNPVALCVDRHYYLVAYDPAISDYRHYRVDRMEGLTVTDADRDPLPEESKACIPWLRQQFQLIRPKIVVCLGRVAAQQMMDPAFSISRDHGRFYEKQGTLFMATYHPAALLRYPVNKPAVFGDFVSLREKITQVCEHTY